MPRRTQDHLNDHREDLRKAFAAMATFDVHPTGKNPQTYGIYLHKTGQYVGSIKKGFGSHLFRTLAVLIEHARERTLFSMPYPSKAQSKRGVRRRPLPTPAIPPPVDIPICVAPAATDTGQSHDDELTTTSTSIEHSIM